MAPVWNLKNPEAKELSGKTTAGQISSYYANTNWLQPPPLPVLLQGTVT
jgi:hypothetical protein